MGGGDPPQRQDLHHMARGGMVAGWRREEVRA